MGDAIAAIRRYVGDMLSVTRALLAPLEAQLEVDAVRESPDARWLLDRLHRTIHAHVDELREHLRRLGGVENGGAGSNLATQLLGSAASELTAGADLAKTLRDDYTALALAHAGALMLETNARALGFASTAALAARHRDELGAMLRWIRELLPAAVKGEIATSGAYDVAM